MIAGSDAGAQAEGRRIITHERRDKDLVRTVGVLTKADLPADGDMRSHILNTQRAFPMLNGYYAVSLLLACTYQLAMTRCMMHECSKEFCNLHSVPFWDHDVV